MRRIALALGLASLISTGAAAQDVAVYQVEADFDDVAFVLETAIIDRGFVVDHVSHVGEMLNRTAADVGATAQVFERADVYLFCSAVLSRKMMEADPNNIAHCPYGVFLYALTDETGTVHVGYRHQPDGPMQEVESLLDAVAREAAGLD
ncbi:MAG: DUF302 domain-containing protein [Paracoccaceae bacterium]|nr:DUF302 domain-containing protein [Paracoccaceae bacterium]